MGRRGPFIAVAGVVLAAVVLGAAGAAWAQAAELTLKLNKTYGFNAGNRIQGLFRLEASGPADLTSVTFLVDDVALATVTEAPFRTSFNTDDYAPGAHSLGATGQTAAGQTVTAAPKQYQFLSASEVQSNMVAILMPVGVVMAIILLGSVAIPLLSMRGGKSRAELPLGTPRQYGFSGGGICRYCGRPYPRHAWAPNILVGKFDRCENCGRWQVSFRASPQQLAAAEAAELRQAAQTPKVPELSEDEKLRRQLDESRFSE